MRPTWYGYFLNLARSVAWRSDCERDQVGAVIVKDNRIVSTGYNGAPAGEPGCETCPRRLSGVARGSNYDNCVAVHAEANAIAYGDYSAMKGGAIYLTREPCTTCTKLIKAAGITEVHYPR